MKAGQAAIPSEAARRTTAGTLGALGRGRLPATSAVADDSRCDSTGPQAHKLVGHGLLVMRRSPFWTFVQNPALVPLGELRFRPPRE